MWSQDAADAAAAAAAAIALRTTRQHQIRVEIAELPGVRGGGCESLAANVHKGGLRFHFAKRRSMQKCKYTQFRLSSECVLLKTGYKFLVGLNRQ